MTKQTEPTLPRKKYRHHGLTLTVWENKGEYGMYDTMTIEKSYKDDKGEWQKSESYAERDLLVLKELIGAYVADVVRAKDDA